MTLDAGLGDEEIGAGDADIRGEEALPQDAARLAQQIVGSSSGRSGSSPWAARKVSATCSFVRWTPAR